MFWQQPKESVVCKGLPMIEGLALQHQLSAWCAAAIQYHHRHKDHDEAMLIQSLKGCCVIGGAVYSIVTNPSNDKSMANLSPDDYAVNMAVVHKNQWIAKYNAERKIRMGQTELAQLIDRLYPEFALPEDLSEMLNAQEDVLEEVNVSAAAKAEAYAAIDAINDMIQQQADIHEQRSLGQKCVWLRQQPFLREEILKYEELQRINEELDKATGGLDLTKQANSYDSFQLKYVHDFRAIH